MEIKKNMWIDGYNKRRMGITKFDWSTMCMFQEAYNNCDNLVARKIF